MAYNWRKVKAIENQNKKIFLLENNKLNDNSGIYFLTRVDENGFKYAYVGQAKHILTRLAQHLVGYQHIDLSLKKHKIYSSKNEYGWKVDFVNCDENELDEKEQFYIKEYADNGFQLRNKTSGGQGEGKNKIAEFKANKGYHDGLKQGYKNASKEISHLFDLHLEVKIKGNKENPTKNQQKALDKFNEFLRYCKDIDNENE